MLTPAELEKIPEEFRRILSNTEMRVMGDIIRRIKINGEITRSADYQIKRLLELGEARKTIDEILGRSIALTRKALDEMYTKAIEDGYTRAEDIYKTTGKEFLPYKDNPVLQQLVDAVKQQTLETFRNITRSAGFVKKVNGKIKFSSLADTYQHSLNNAMMDITTGTFDYNTVIKRTIKELTESGLRTIDYASGHTDRVGVAARRAIMTGITQITNKINEDNARALGTNFFEVSWHGTARPTHQIWQGRVYSSEELVSVCGLGGVDGLGGANCRHSYSPFVKGYSVRAYTDEQLEEMGKKEGTQLEYKGKYYTSYEATQRQRKLESIMRKQRQQIKLLGQGGADMDDITDLKCKYRSTMQQYVDFSKKMGLPQQRERIYSDSLGKV